MTLAAVALAASGCATAAGPASAPTDSAAAVASPSPSEIVGETVTGVGSTGWPGVYLPFPAGARSVSIDFTCDGSGPYVVELGDTMAENTAAISGLCGDQKPMMWPVTPDTLASIAVTVVEGSTWKAIPYFSTAESPRDAAVTAECTAFTDIFSALFNADQCYSNYKAFDAAVWSTRVQDASSQLEELAGESTSSLKPVLAAMLQTVASATVPGTALAGTDDAVAHVRAACDANQTPSVINAEFGG